MISAECNNSRSNTWAWLEVTYGLGRFRLAHRQDIAPDAADQICDTWQRHDLARPRTTGFQPVKRPLQDYRYLDVNY
jgi:hypothetical protein